MGSRGRKSTAELSIAPVSIETRRPKPPAELNEQEAAVWRDVTGTMPRGWFSRAQFPILIAYCRHTARSSALAAQINAFEAEWLKVDGGIDRYNRLLSMAERESRALISCARSMRLTHQARILPRGAGRAMVNGEARTMPWEYPELPIGQDPMFDDYEG